VYRDRPELTLVGFAKATLAVGAEQELRIAIAARRMQVWDGGWTDVAGAVRLLVGRSSIDLPFTITI